MTSRVVVIKIHPSGGRSKAAAEKRELRRYTKLVHRFQHSEAYAAVNDDQIHLIELLVSKGFVVLPIPANMIGNHGAINNFIDRSFVNKNLILIEGDFNGLYEAYTYSALDNRDITNAISDLFASMKQSSKSWGTFAHHPGASAYRVYMALNGIILGLAGRPAIFDPNLRIKEDVDAGLTVSFMHQLQIRPDIFERHTADKKNQPLAVVNQAVAYINRKHPECHVKVVVRPFMNKGLTPRVEVSFL